MSVREEILSKLFPDHSIQVTEEVQIKVYPLGVRHLSKFSNKLTWIFSEIGKITVTQKGADESSEAFQGRVGKELLSSLGPILLTELLDLLSECCEVIYKGKKTKEITLEDLPHEVLPEISEYWIEESFISKKKYLKWVGVIERIYKKISGNDLSIMETFSSPSS